MTDKPQFHPFPFIIALVLLLSIILFNSPLKIFAAESDTPTGYVKWSKAELPAPFNMATGYNYVLLEEKWYSSFADTDMFKYTLLCSTEAILKDPTSKVVYVKNSTGVLNNVFSSQSVFQYGINRTTHEVSGYESWQSNLINFNSVPGTSSFLYTNIVVCNNPIYYSDFSGNSIPVKDNPTYDGFKESAIELPIPTDLKLTTRYDYKGNPYEYVLSCTIDTSKYGAQLFQYVGDTKTTLDIDYQTVLNTLYFHIPYKSDITKFALQSVKLDGTGFSEYAYINVDSSVVIRDTPVKPNASLYYISKTSSNKEERYQYVLSVQPTNYKNYGIKVELKFNRSNPTTPSAKWLSTCALGDFGTSYWSSIGYKPLKVYYSLLDLNRAISESLQIDPSDALYTEPLSILITQYLIADPSAVSETVEFKLKDAKWLDSFEDINTKAEQGISDPTAVSGIDSLDLSQNLTDIDMNTAITSSKAFLSSMQSTFTLIGFVMTSVFPPFVWNILGIGLILLVIVLVVKAIL